MAVRSVTILFFFSFFLCPLFCFDSLRMRDFLYCAGRVTGYGVDCGWDIDCIFSKIHFHQRGDEIENQCLKRKRFTVDIEKFQQIISQSECAHYQKNKKKLWMALDIKNQVDDVLLFIIHHALLGVNHFIIVDDHSTDNLRETLDPLIKAHWVTYLKGPRKHQSASYTMAKKKALEAKVTWVGFMDADEYFFSHEFKCVYDALKRHENKNNVAQVSINRQRMPGSFNLTDPLHSSLFSLSGFCTQGEFDPQTKTFIRPLRVSGASIHNFGNKPGKTQIHYTGAKMPKPVFLDTNLQTNLLHFQFKSFTKYIEKIHRGTGNMGRERDFAKILIPGVSQNAPIGGPPIPKEERKKINQIMPTLGGFTPLSKRHDYITVGKEQIGLKCNWERVGGERLKEVHKLFFEVVSVEEEVVGVDWLVGGGWEVPGRGGRGRWGERGEEEEGEKDEEEKEEEEKEEEEKEEEEEEKEEEEEEEEEGKVGGDREEKEGVRGFGF